MPGVFKGPLSVPSELFIAKFFFAAIGSDLKISTLVTKTLKNKMSRNTEAFLGEEDTKGFLVPQDLVS